MAAKRTDELVIGDTITTDTGGHYTIRELERVEPYTIRIRFDEGGTLDAHITRLWFVQPATPTQEKALP